MIIAKLALATSIYYDLKVRCKMKFTLTIVNYNLKPFIVQATGHRQRRTNRIKLLKSRHEIYSNFLDSKKLNS
jgi:hypothetical protein